MTTNANDVPLALDDEGLPTYDQIEPNAVEDNLIKSKHIVSYVISVAIWLLIISSIILIILQLVVGGGFYFVVIITSSCLAFFCLVNCCECSFSSTSKYFANRFDSATELVNYIS